MDVTNVFNNKKFVFIKDSEVIESVLIPDEDVDILEQIKNNVNADFYLDATDIPYAGVHSHYIDGELTTAKNPDAKSFIWDSVAKCWYPPIPMPEGDNWQWDEKTLSWIEIN